MARDEPIRTRRISPTTRPSAAPPQRSIALGLVLGALVVIFYVLTIVKMGPAVFDRAL